MVKNISPILVCIFAITFAIIPLTDAKAKPERDRVHSIGFLTDRCGDITEVCVQTVDGRNQLVAMLHFQLATIRIDGQKILLKEISFNKTNLKNKKATTRYYQNGHIIQKTIPTESTISTFQSQDLTLIVNLVRVSIDGIRCDGLQKGKMTIQGENWKRTINIKSNFDPCG